jgi:hypothetical protein
MGEYGDKAGAGAPDRRRFVGVLIAVAVLAGVWSSVVAARSTAVPKNTAVPTLSGQTREGSTLTTTNGTWDNAPTSFKYQWQRCAANGTGCANIAGATNNSYTLASADVDHTMRSVVTATNADGSASADSKPSGLISAKDAPVNTAKPTISGNAVAGSQLTATTGTWTGGATSFSFQWQQCPAGTLVCVNVAGATGRTYGVRSSDIGQRLRIAVTARNASGPATAYSDPTNVVTASPGNTTTTVVTTTVPGAKPPTLTFLSLRRSGNTIYARFRVCADNPGRITVTERDNKPRALSYTRRFVVTVTSCGTFARQWSLIRRFRGPGRFVVTLRAADASGALSTLVSRSLNFR